jgi:hypothetical protein
MKKTALITLLSILFLNFITINLEKDLIGTWEFVELIDSEGNKIDTIWHGMGYELAAGPIITLREDGTYSKQFTPTNTDNGKWSYNQENKSLEFKLTYEKPYDIAAQYLIDNGHAKKDDNGDYFEVITKKVIEFSDSTLVFEEREGAQKKYMKTSH